MHQQTLLNIAPEAQQGDRVANDYYPTADPITLGLKRLLLAEGLYSPDHVVFGPCAGDGAISRHFDCCLTNEPNWSGDFVPLFCLDALDSEVWDNFSPDIDWTIENPPYGDQFPEKLLRLAWEHSRVGVALHLRLTWLEGTQKNEKRGIIGRRELIDELWDHLRFVQSINPRCQFRRNTRGSDSVTTAWFVWVKGWSWQAQGISNPFQYILDWRE